MFKDPDEIVEVFLKSGLVCCKFPKYEFADFFRAFLLPEEIDDLNTYRVH